MILLLFVAVIVAAIVFGPVIRTAVGLLALVTLVTQPAYVIGVFAHLLSGMTAIAAMLAQGSH